MPGVTRTLANTNVSGSVYGVDPTASNGVIDPLTGQAAAPTAIDPLTGLPVVDPQAVIDPLTGLPVVNPTIDPLTGNVITDVYGTAGNGLVGTLSTPTAFAAGPRTWETNTWDAANRLISNTNVSGDVTTYSYDGDNNRVGMSTRIGSGAVQDLYPSSNPAGMRDGWEPQYKKEQIDIYFANDTTMSLPEPLMATGANGKKWEQSYVYRAGGERISMSYLPSADANTDWEPTPGASGALPNTTPKTLYYLSDVRGSAIGLVGQDGSISARYDYDEFGVAKDAQKFDLNYPGPDNLFGYTGLGFDFNSGYTYARARYLDSSIGRFVSEDTYEGNLKNPLS